MAPMESVAAAVSGTASINAFLEDYARFIAKQRLRHITVEQVIGAHLKCRGPVKNTPPPRSLWRNIVPTLRVADRLVRELDVPLVEIISAYRSKSYNARCPGACRGRAGRCCWWPLPASPCSRPRAGRCGKTTSRS